MIAAHDLRQNAAFFNAAADALAYKEIVTTLLTSKTPIIEGRLDAGANLADYMGM
ncbi:MAG: hypothetical protein KIC63_04900 [Clostridium sp.]|nr:hypothetical protein [Clostridium sp.]